MNKIPPAYLQNFLPWYGQEVLDFVQEHLWETWADSAGGRIHLDVYRGDPGRPTVVLSHGMAGYGRLLANFAWVLHRRGFNVVLPDLKGYGHNPGQRGHWRWHELVQNLLDSCRWATANLGPRVHLAGASMGGPLAYHAVCHGAAVRSLICYCLFDLSWPDFIRASSRFGPLTPLAGASVKLWARLLPRLPLPATLVSSYDNLSSDPAFNRTVKRDPLAGNWMSVAAAAELIGTPLPVPFERFDRVPVLVLNPEADAMTPSRFTRRAYEALGTGRKQYLPIPGEGHWVLARARWEAAFGSVADWIDGVERDASPAVTPATVVASDE